MDEVYIRTQDMARWVAEKYFNNKDFITLDEFYRAFEDLSCDYEHLKEEYQRYLENEQEQEEYYGSSH